MTGTPDKPADSGVSRDGNGAAAAAAAPAVPLDDVMLAMDIVDTLRHQQDLLEAELDEDRRQQDFTARVQAIYQGQGIEVPPHVIADAVRSLRERRFTYHRPPRTFHVRLAEIYVERGKWGLRLVVALLLLALVIVSIVVPLRLHRQGLEDGFERAVAAQSAIATRLQADAQQVDADVQQLRAAAGAVVVQLLDEASAALRRHDAALQQAKAGLVALPEPTDYPQQQRRCDDQVQRLRELLVMAGNEIGTARGLVRGVRTLQSLQTRVAAVLDRLQGTTLDAREQTELDRHRRAAEEAIQGGDSQAAERTVEQLKLHVDQLLTMRSRQAAIRARFEQLRSALAGVDIEAGAAAELTELRTDASGAIQGGDWARAETLTGRLHALVQVLDQRYELRIVSRPQDRSGVWRHPADDPGARNYYIVVEAIGADGQPMALPITNEEDQRTRNVSRFGIRVPESVYEAVKQDKQDNGIIDRTLFGRKRRGARVPDYEFKVAGGHITEW